MKQPTTYKAFIVLANGKRIEGQGKTYIEACKDAKQRAEAQKIKAGAK